ncbi:MAG: polysaccharide pyruvyl transferase family protein [Lachnospiraceae bacterium]|nr:polysaccharide pyruvyl transferase family protein [Lachnospiraceae bacterium]
MKIAMIGIYGGMERDFNPGNVLIAYYSKREIEKRLKFASIDIYSLDFSIHNITQKKCCFGETPFKMEITFFSTNKIDELCELFCAKYQAVVIGGDIVIGLSDVFFLNKLISQKKRPMILLNVVSSLWRSHLVSETQKSNLRRMADSCEYISVRENYVKDLMKMCGVEKTINVIPDPVVLHQKGEWDTPEEVSNFISELKKQGKKIVCISECFLHTRDMVEALIKSSVIKECTVLFFAYSRRYNHSNKAKEYKSILNEHCCCFLDYLNPWAAYSMIENINLCVSNAYHCCVAAITSGIPFIGIDPSPFESSRHTDILCDKEQLEKSILKVEVVNNDHSGVSLQKYFEKYLKNELHFHFDLSQERQKVEEHFDQMCKIML